MKTCTNWIGAYSEASCKLDDILPAAMDLLDSMKEEHSMDVEPGQELECSTLIGKIDAQLGAIERRTEREGYYESEEADHDLDMIVDYIQDLLPPYLYVGMHPYDGACWGVWPSIDSLDEDAMYGDVLKVNDLADIPGDYRGEVMLVSDHGNVTYGYADECGEFVHVWDCV